ncbi:DUF5753 domain-containing protein [Hamadaea flava]|uniref:DUF5753 domain-containing protein n=1 Tax=Hamadaea flava TaxID=1742688 RepID=A0ABV8M049_9ACTN
MFEVSRVEPFSYRFEITWKTNNDLVADASIIRHFETAWIPGLLQTPAYARAVFTEMANMHVLDVRNEDSAVAARLARQPHLYDPSKRFEFILCEPVLRWRTVPNDVLLPQFDRLLMITELPNVRFGIVPLDRHLGMTPQNAFQIYDNVAVIETFAGETYFESAESAAYLRIMERLWLDVVTGAAANEIIRNAMQRLRD